ncbi:Peroxidase 19 [Hordeum vulgare]|nr:Peroxidase 19 [Hordeum vulgare]
MFEEQRPTAPRPQGVRQNAYKDVITNDTSDNGFLTHGSSFTSRCAYSLLFSDHKVDFNAGHIWSSNTPIKI